MDTLETIISLLGVLGAIGLYLFGRRSGKKSLQDSIDIEAGKRDKETRKKVDEANENISSDNEFITDWLRKTGRFRK